MKYLIIVLALSVSMVSACGRDNQTRLAGGANPLAPTTDDGRAAIENPRLLAMGSIQEQRCDRSPLTAIADVSEKKAWDFSGNDFIHAIDLFSDRSCSTPYITIFYRGTFERHKDLGNDTYEIDYLFKTASVVARNEEGVKTLNTLNFCGKSDYVINQEIDLTEQSTNALCILHDVPRTFYDIYKVDGDVVYFGKASGFNPAATEPDKRATELDRESPFVKR